jgi:acyl carrier protein
MNSKQEIATSLQQFVLRHFPVARQHHIGLDDSLLEMGIVDSLGVLEIVTFIEHDLGLRLSDDELLPEHFESIATLADLVHGRLHPERAS